MTGRERCPIGEVESSEDEEWHQGTRASIASRAVASRRTLSSIEADIPQCRQPGPRRRRD